MSLPISSQSSYPYRKKATFSQKLKFFKRNFDERLRGSPSRAKQVLWRRDLVPGGAKAQPQRDPVVLSGGLFSFTSSACAISKLVPVGHLRCCWHGGETGLLILRNFAHFKLNSFSQHRLYYNYRT
jgi:hypothetical protein